MVFLEKIPLNYKMLWIQEPSILLKEPTKFWPKSDDSQDDQINAVSRFIIYGSFVAYFFNREKKIFISALIILFALVLFTKFRHVTPFANKESPFNPEDPFGNFSEYRKYDKDNVQKAMEKIFPEDTVNAQRQFFSMPNNDMGEFLEYVHGGKKPFCRQDQSACSADDNPRMMELPHLRATMNIPVFL